MIIRKPCPMQAPSRRTNAGIDSETDSRNCASDSPLIWSGFESFGLWICFGFRDSDFGFSGLQRIKQLIDTERLVQDVRQAVLAGLDDGVRGIVAIAGHEDDVGAGLSL